MNQLMHQRMRQQQHLLQTPDGMLIIFGLGNPGPEYEGTRHNAGVETLEKLAASYRAKLVRRCFSSYRTCIITSECGNKARLVFPLTYMNGSGKTVPRVVKENDEVIVICDQMDLPPGRVRLRASGSSAGHNGLKSMMAYLPGNFKRLYIGVGRPVEGTSVVDHVLSIYSDDDRKLVDAAQMEAVKCLRRYIDGEDFSRCAQDLNSFRGDLQ